MSLYLVVLIILTLLIILGFIFRFFESRDEREQLVYLRLLFSYKYGFNYLSSAELFSQIHLILAQGNILAPKQSKLIIDYSSQGINLFLGINPKIANLVINRINSLGIDIEVEKISYNPEEINNLHNNYLKQFKLILKKHFIFPLIFDEKSDPLNKLVLDFSNLKSFEEIQFEFKIRPWKSYKVNYYKRFLLSNKYQKEYNYSLFFSFINSLIFIITGFFKLLKYILLSFDNNSNKNKTKNYKKLYLADPKITQSLDKLYDQHFKTDIKIKFKSSYLYRINEITHDLKLDLESLNQGHVQKFRLLKDKHKNIKDINNIFSSHELAIFFRVATLKDAQRFYQFNNFKKLYLSAKQKKDLNNKDIILGQSYDKDINNLFGLSNDERKKHLLIVGTTGSGKSSLMFNLINQDIRHKNGLCLIDPHGDLAKKVIANLHPKDKNRVIDFNIHNLDLININLLHNYSQTKQEAERIAEDLLSIFKKVFNDQNINANRIEYILRNAILTLLDIQEDNLFALFNLLTSSEYLNKVILKIKDSQLKSFWKDEIKKAGDFQKVKLIFGASSKVGRIIFSSVLSQVLDKHPEAIDFDEIIQSKKILICNLSKGDFGEDLTKIIGLIIISKLQLTILNQAKINPKKRAEFYLYVDEFQNYINHNFCLMLAEVRKYGLIITVAEQSISQQEIILTEKLLANISNYAVFKLINQKDQQTFINYFSPQLGKKDFLNILNYNFYFVSFTKLDSQPISLKLLE